MQTGPSQPEAEQDSPLYRAAARFWRGLLGPWPLLPAGLFGAVLVLANRSLPQLPGQFNDEPAAAGRWLATTTGQYPGWGSAFQALGLFNVVHSPLLAALLVFVVLIATAHLARDIARLRQFTRLPELLSRPSVAPGEPLPLHAVDAVARRRELLLRLPAELAADLDQRLITHFSQMQRREVPLPAPPEAGTEPSADGAEEHRLLATHRAYARFLQPLLPLGILLLVTPIWLSMAFGWQVTTPPLAPGASYRAANQGLIVLNPAPQDSNASPPAEITLQGKNRQVSGGDSTRLGMDGATVTLRRDLPALWISSLDDTPLMAQPDTQEPVTELGLVFPTPGSEESVLLPNEVAGLRLVRRTDSPDAFVVELYRSTDVQPSLRAEVSMPDALTIPLENGGELQILPTRALQADVRYLPGLWLAWLALPALIAGAVGALLRPAYLLLQIAPWPGKRSVLVAQASHSDDLETLYTLLDSESVSVRPETEPVVPITSPTP